MFGRPCYCIESVNSNFSVNVRMMFEIFMTFSQNIFYSGAIEQMLIRQNSKLNEKK